MAMAMWAKKAAGPNMAYVKQLHLQLRSWKEVIQQTFWRKVGLPKQQRVVQVRRVAEADVTPASEHYLHKTTSLQSRFFRSLFSRTSRSLVSELRRRTACRLSSSQVQTFRNVPLCSLIGVTLGYDAASLISSNRDTVMEEMQGLFSDYGWQAEAMSNPPKSLDDLEISLESLASGCEGAVYKAKVKPPVTEEANGVCESEKTDADFDLAVKAVFNYGAASNAESILREMRREYVPLHMTEVQDNHILADRVGRLPPHPNIVDMPGIFEDDVLVTEEGLKKFPAAMPRRIDPEMCWGRNKTLYVVMRRRSTHLRDYLSKTDVSMETRCMLLAQFLEGVSHLVQHGIAHRDLKADNILVDIPSGGGVPKLEICDFGCCLAEENRSLCMDYPCVDVYKGGNSWLMAPEIARTKAGRGQVLDYTKADLWAAGTIAYEILGGENPFYPSKDSSHRQLSTWDYCEDDLLQLPGDVPEPVQKLVLAMLSSDPKDRPSASVAAAVVQMLVLDNLTGPRPPTMRPPGLRGGVHKPRHRQRRPQKKAASAAAVEMVTREKERFQWVLVQSLALLCQLRFGRDKSEVWDVPSVLRFLFLTRLTYTDFKEALHFF